MTQAKSLDEAHREADCAVVCHQWYKEILVARGDDTTDADTLIADAQQRITDLTAQQAPPGDVSTVRDAYFQAAHDNLTDVKTRLDTIIDDATLGPLLYPDADIAEATVYRTEVVEQIDALNLVWTP